MNPGGPAESWFDRLAAPQTRRQTFRAALAGMALTLPFARAGAGHAANPNGRSADACRKGCFYTSHIQHGKRASGCTVGPVASFATSFLTGLWFGPIGGPAVQYANKLGARRCLDEALIQQKAQQYDCLQPDCPGFDPEGPDGPCSVCIEGAQCCPYQGSTLGYVCCAYCHPSGDACGSAPS